MTGLATVLPLSFRVSSLYSWNARFLETVGLELTCLWQRHRAWYQFERKRLWLSQSSSHVYQRLREWTFQETSRLHSQMAFRPSGVCLQLWRFGRGCVQSNLRSLSFLRSSLESRSGCRFALWIARFHFESSQTQQVFVVVLAHN
jgi:hypothetical protein